MNRGMVRCKECGMWFFNRWKLGYHLMMKHGYVTELPKEEDDEEVSN